MRTLRISFVALALGTALVGCGGASHALVPVDSPILPWEAPEQTDAPADAPAATPAAEPHK